MNLLILGATGRVGSHLVTYALQEGHHVTALVRSPEKIEISDEKLAVLEGNVLQIKDIQAALHGCDAVISALNTDKTTTLSDSIPRICDAMKKEGITRLVTVGTAGILQSRLEPDKLRYQSSESRRRSAAAAIEHHKVYTFLKDSGLEWTIVCPTYLPDGIRTGSYRTERDMLPEGGTEISVQDTAEFALSQLKSTEFMKLRAGICY
ncbi:SDR family oxidoreductase [Bacillus sp. MUM 13]|uniref:NAD(P)-dependent oxidoreductase n=1 Tax=Bacillus sp. MUM 13 TaxID=1678001 RepID=UPI0008F56583|nr:SDR family oxidoreductase [Bacillus sp. MUM 13]OIK08943.1 hypothetical protein BIV59_18375 [Bacillus sp. MUM 13]